MNKKILISLITIAAVAAIAVGGTVAYFSDTETSTGNTFSTGTLNLKVNGNNGPFTLLFSADNMKPGHDYNAGCVILKNNGSMPGEITVKVTNLESKENGLYEPEISDGDVAGQEIDPTGYNANSGDGELWDQITVKMCFDDGTGSHTGNGKCDWDDTIIKDFSSTQDDYSTTYSIKTNVDLASNAHKILQPGESVDFCVGVRFIDDKSNMWWGGQGSLTNNMAMSDQALMDIVFGLQQVD